MSICDSSLRQNDDDISRALFGLGEKKVHSNTLPRQIAPTCVPNYFEKAKCVLRMKWLNGGQADRHYSDWSGPNYGPIKKIFWTHLVLIDFEAICGRGMLLHDMTPLGFETFDSCVTLPKLEWKIWHGYANFRKRNTWFKFPTPNAFMQYDFSLQLVKIVEGKQSDLDMLVLSFPR